LESGECPKSRGRSVLAVHHTDLGYLYHLVTVTNSARLSDLDLTLRRTVQDHTE
jgi:hypothetical protein